MPEILKLHAPCKDYIWGGNKLKGEYGKISDSDIIAESWELSCHKDGESVISGGEYAGMGLSAYIKEKGKSILGENTAGFADFPVLIKFIDAKDRLSVQVHPDDEYALKYEAGYGKTEMWYVLDCEEGAELIYGLKKEITEEEFSRRIKDNSLLEITNNVKVKKGDVFFIEAGTLHGIGKGILIAEVQQNSNTTYRIYDYGRTGADGKPRRLHIEKALDVTRLTPVKRKPKPEGKPEKIPGGEKTLLARHKYFNVNLLDLNGEAVFTAGTESFNSVLVIEGDGKLNGLKAKKGDSYFIPAGFGEYKWEGTGKLIITDIV